MSANQFVPKAVLFEELRTIFAEKNSAMLTLLTETKKSVLMRFSEGRLTSARCRSWDIENTIEALAETESVKFSMMKSVAEDKPTLMEADAFWGMVNPLGGPLETMIKLMPEAEKIEQQVNIDIDGNIIQPHQEEAPEEEDKFAVDKAQAAKMNFF